MIIRLIRIYIWVGAHNTLKSGYFTRTLISKSESGTQNPEMT